VIFYQSIALVLGILIGSLSWSNDVPINVNESWNPESQLDKSVMDKLLSLGDINPSDFGIKNGCINTNRIRSIDFIDDRTAYLDIGGGRQVVLNLANRCLGIKARGFIQKTRTNRLCARFDSLEVIDSGMRCRIQSFEPHITLDTHD